MLLKSPPAIIIYGPIQIHEKFDKLWSHLQTISDYSFEAIIYEKKNHKDCIVRVTEEFLQID